MPSSTLTDPRTIKLTRKLMIEWGYKAQRLAHRAAKALWADPGNRRASAGHRSASAADQAQVIHFINKPMPGNLPKRTSRALLDIEDDKVIPVIRNPRRSATIRRGVLLPGLRLGAPVQRRSGWRRRRCSTKWARDRAAAGLPVLRLSADCGRRSRTRVRRSPPTTACCSTASPTRSTISTSRP
jgi:hypothetical protein